MGKFTKSNSSARLNTKFEKLAFDQGDGDDGNFLSGWQCENPFVSDLLQSVRDRATTLDHRRYTYFDSHGDLIQSIHSHHKRLDAISPQAVICGCGTTSLLSTFAAYLHSIGVSKVYYIPPLYITLQTALESYGIIAEAVSSKQPYEDDFYMDLPDINNPVLLLTDPVWYAGTSINHRVIDDIAAWQQTTKALIFVDGSLQYMPWVGPRYEATSILDPSLTIRLICPSKQLCIHGYRFSYLLVPTSHSRSLAWTYTNIFGPAPADSVAFAHEAIAAISDGSIPKQIMSITSHRYEHMLNEADISSTIAPNCGYFVFAKILRTLPADYICIDGTYFAQESYPGYIKLNLLSPSLKLISNAHTISTISMTSQTKEIAKFL